MSKTGINHRETKSTRHMSLQQLALCTAHPHRSSQACPLELWEARAPFPKLSLMKSLLGSSEWLGSSCQTQSWFHRGGEAAFPYAGKQCIGKLAAGVGIREAGEGYHHITMATVSLASPSPNLASPHQLVCSLRDCD